MTGCSLCGLEHPPERLAQVWHESDQQVNALHCQVEDYADCPDCSALNPHAKNSGGKP